MIALLAAAALSATPLRAQTLESAYAQGRAAAAPDAEAIEAALRGADRTAAREAARQAGAAMGSFDDAAQLRVVLALREAAESGLSAPEVRAECVLRLGESAPYVRDEYARRVSAEELLAVIEAAPSDARSSFRRHALEGFSAAARALPRDPSLERRAAAALLAVDASADGAERTLSLLALRELIAARPDVARTAEDPQGRVRAAVLEPLQRDASGWVGVRASDERWAAYRVLLALAWADDRPGARLDVKRALAAASDAETDGLLRRTARLWSDAIRAA